MLKEIKIKDIKELNIMAECGSNDPILHINGGLYKLEEVEEYAKLLESKNVKIVYEVEDEILDKEEKKYLGNLIKPFRDRVVGITKHSGSRESQFITIVMGDDVDIDLPDFEKNYMYKNMIESRQYTLEELGL